MIRIVVILAMIAMILFALDRRISKQKKKQILQSIIALLVGVVLSLVFYAAWESFIKRDLSKSIEIQYLDSERLAENRLRIRLEICNQHHAALEKVDMWVAGYLNNRSTPYPLESSAKRSDASTMLSSDLIIEAGSCGIDEFIGDFAKYDTIKVERLEATWKDGKHLSEIRR